MTSWYVACKLSRNWGKTSRAELFRRGAGVKVSKNMASATNPIHRRPRVSRGYKGTTG
jgi:hypothetical protein